MEGKKGLISLLSILIIFRNEYSIYIYTEPLKSLKYIKIIIILINIKTHIKPASFNG